MATYLEIVCGIAIVLLALYYYFTSTFNFWKSRGVPGPKPIVGFGNVLNVLIGRTSFQEYLQNLNKTYEIEPLVGIFLKQTPVLIIQNEDLVKDVLIKDFNIFTNRGFLKSEPGKPMTHHLFALEAKRWRPLRTQLTPVFTTGKLKGTFSLILNCAEDLEKRLEVILEKQEPVDIRELAARFTIDVIGNCAFGIEMNSLSETECEFRQIGKEIFEANFWTTFNENARVCLPLLYNFLDLIVPYDKVTKFMIRITNEMMEYRKKNNIIRSDFINILLELQKHPEKVGDLELTDSLLAAQVYVFFAAGFETSSTTISHILYELAQNHEVQDKLRAEIEEYNAKTKGDWKYEILREMIYLDKVFNETLRKYPPLAFLSRESVSSYTFKNTKVSIPKKTKVWIPIYAFHWNPNIYPEPEKFDPERFDEHMKKMRHPMHYLPFGDGSRNCIGARFAIYQVKVGLIKILQNCKVDICEKTPFPYEINPFSFILVPKQEIYLKMTKVKK